MLKLRELIHPQHFGGKFQAPVGNKKVALNFKICLRQTGAN